jgi:hypothetical protein
LGRWFYLASISCRFARLACFVEYDIRGFCVIPRVLTWATAHHVLTRATALRVLRATALNVLTWATAHHVLHVRATALNVLTWATAHHVLTRATALRVLTRATALRVLRATALPQPLLKKRRHSRLLPTGRGKEVAAQEGFLWPQLLLLTCFDSRGRSAVDLCLAFSESRKDRRILCLSSCFWISELRCAALWSDRVPS